MNGVFYKLFENIGKIFSGRNLLWHLAFILATAGLVLSGLDWWYFEQTRNLRTIGLTAGLAGFAIPVFVPLGMYLASSLKKNVRLRNAANAIVQAGILGWAVSTSYKVFTGRPGLPHMIAEAAADTSDIFRFGFYRGGAFQGWPSSHTSVAFAMSMALIALYPENKYIRFFAIAYALFIGLGASVGFHWLSDFVAGGRVRTPLVILCPSLYAACVCIYSVFILLAEVRIQKRSF